MKLRLAQLEVTTSISQNLQNILTTLEAAQTDEWVMFPEGIVSGYFPEHTDFLTALDTTKIEQAITRIKVVTRDKNIHCLFGSALYSGGDWFNAAIYADANQEYIYYKNNLSTLDRNHFSAGHELCTYQAAGITFGIQMCRELAFPEQWKALKKAGAQVILHLNNSIKESDAVREHVLISRAFENQLWVCSVNNGAAPQTMRSMLIDPFGTVVWQSTPQTNETYTRDIDLAQDSNVYLDQERTDLVLLQTTSSTS